MSAAQFARAVRRGGAVLALALVLPHATATAGLVSGIGPQSDDARVETLVLAQAAKASAPSVSPLLKPAPNLFEATGTALWDGRRTLQGVWVAHPLATSARRVRIFNVQTGAAVDGALFKRDPGLTGPSVLISSQAAELLGMPPGEEVGLRIVALTPVQQREPPPVAEAPLTAEPAALEQPGAPVTTAPETAAATMAAMPPVGSAAPAPAPAPADTGAAPAAPPPGTAAAPAEVVRTTPASPLPPPREAVAPPEAPEPEIAAAPPPSAPVPASSTALEPAAASQLAKPYVQAGTFGVHDNAARLIARLEAADVPAVARPASYGGREMTRVLAGPFATTAERDAALSMIREMGLGDALPVAR